MTNKTEIKEIVNSDIHTAFLCFLSAHETGILSRGEFIGKTVVLCEKKIEESEQRGFDKAKSRAVEVTNELQVEAVSSKCFSKEVKDKHKHFISHIMAGAFDVSKEAIQNMKLPEEGE